ncbi:MAG: hypothetical protein J3T61_03120 [Candidatus Brocadiales bacterium]|nr:hypothetical protein [Candidatus Bathyanammoxibius sp.]
MVGIPLLFTITEKVEGNGFMADVTMRGRILGVKEDGDVWMYGVQPGGIAAGGKDEGTAYLEFRQTLKTVLFDILIDSPDFRSFKREFKKFFEEVSRPNEVDWWEAVEEARRGRIKVKGIPTVNADTEKPYLEVKKIQNPQAKHNILEPYTMSAVAA